jgi:catechol 2,3-dioxygenase-like lactoylglutathione lyase family enzyme
VNIDHVNIAAPLDLLEKVRDFYCDVLGLTEGFRPNFSQDGYWLYAKDKALVHLVVSENHHANERQGYFDHFALRTTGKEQVIERLHRHQVEYTRNYLQDIGLTQIFCRDPAGTRVEISFLDRPDP